MKKFMLGLLLVVAMVTVVSCSQDSLAQDDLVSVRFSKLEARAIDDDVYSVAGDATWGGASVEIGDVGDYYWTYKAVKKDDGFTSGQQTEFVNWSENAGLSGAKTFSAGKWYFELKAYATKDDRTAGTKAVFTGEATTDKLTSSTTITVPMSFTYVAGTGAADFTISTTISQPEGKSFAITDVKMVIGTKTVDLTEKNSIWTGSESGIASGRQKVEIEVYVDNEATPRFSDVIGTAYIMHGMTTEVTGSAAVTLTEKTINIDFAPTIPSSALVKAPAAVKAGDSITLGKIPASVETYSGQDISWKVLEVKDNKALVLSDKILFNMKHYNETGMKEWDNSLIKAYLNDESSEGFLSQYGLDNVAIATAAEDEAGYNAGDVFLLSCGEVQSDYFNDSYTSATAYNLAGVACEWWCRNSGQYEYDFKATLSDGYFDEGFPATDELGVRPAFWINIE